MTLKLEQLESRDNAAVHWFVGVVAPSPQGDPGRTVLFFQSDNPVHLHREWTPPPAFSWHGVHPDLVVFNL